MMHSNLKDSIQVLFQKAHIEALISNQNQETKWETYKNDIVDVGERLKTFLKELNVSVMVPIGNKALFRGKLVHTNDIMISLGDGYFTKGSVEQAFEIISRRLKKCDEMLDKLKQERTLLESRARVSSEPDLFPSEDYHEIVEEFNQDHEDSWRQKHSSMVKEYKRKLALMKEEEPTEIKTDEDLWKRLEILELEEELNDELDRLGSDADSENTDTVSSTDDESSEELEKNQSKNINHPGLNKKPRPSIIKYNQSLTANEQSNTTTEKPLEYIKINFKHSSFLPNVKECQDFINSPYDIYNKFSSALGKQKKKLTRRVSFADSPEIKVFKNDPMEHNNSNNLVRDNREVEDQPVAFGDVIERSVPSNFKSNNNRPVSRFKSTRINQPPN